MRVRELGGSTAYERWVTVGNVTTTTVIGLLPDTLYDVAVAAVAENASSVEAWTSFDLYGRRPLMPGAQVCLICEELIITAKITIYNVHRLALSAICVLTR